MRQRQRRQRRRHQFVLNTIGWAVMASWGPLACDDEPEPAPPTISSADLFDALNGAEKKAAVGLSTLPTTGTAPEQAFFEAILQADSGPPLGDFRPAEAYFGERTSLQYPRVTITYGVKPVCLVSHSTPSMAPYARLSMRNHSQYAAAHGYHAVQYLGHLTGPRFMDPSVEAAVHRYGLFWQKIAAVKDALSMRQVDGSPRCVWVMWLDGDALLTNFERSVESVLAPWDSPALAAAGDAKDVVLARQETHFPGVLLNAGIFFVKNSELGNGFIDELVKTQPLYRGRSRFGDQDVMHHIALDLDYELLSDLSWEEVAPRLRPEIGVARAREFNSFFRGERQSQAEDGDGFWQPGDFVCHFSGIKTEARVAAIQQMLGHLARADGQP